MRYVIGHKGARPVSPRGRGRSARSEQATGPPRRRDLRPVPPKRSKSRATGCWPCCADLKAQGKRVVGYGATSKSTTVTNYCGITPDLVEFISDTTPIKQGKFSPGQHIPVVPYESSGALSRLRAALRLEPRRGDHGQGAGVPRGRAAGSSSTCRTSHVESEVLPMIPCSNPRAQYLAHEGGDRRGDRTGARQGLVHPRRGGRGLRARVRRLRGARTPSAVGSGTDAFTWRSRACGIGPGDEVITVAHTAVATVAAIELAGATPVLVDIDPATLHDGPVAGSSAAITPTHQGHRRPCISTASPRTSSAISALAARHRLQLIEDCAQAHGAPSGGRRVGTLRRHRVLQLLPDEEPRRDRRRRHGRHQRRRAGRAHAACCASTAGPSATSARSGVQHAARRAAGRDPAREAAPARRRQRARAARSPGATTRALAGRRSRCRPPRPRRSTSSTCTWSAVRRRDAAAASARAGHRRADPLPGAGAPAARLRGHAAGRRRPARDRARRARGALACRCTPSSAKPKSGAVVAFSACVRGRE